MQRFLSILMFMRRIHPYQEAVLSYIARRAAALPDLALPVVADDRGVLGVYGIGANRDRLAADVPGVEIQFKEVNSSGTL